MTLTDTTPVAPDAALIVIDVQCGFRDPSYGRRDNPGCVQNIAALTAAWAGTGRPIVRVRHASRVTPGPDGRPAPLHPKSPGYAFEPFVEALEPALDVVKSVHSAFHGDVDLHAWLQQRGIHELVVCGIQTNMCCETTSRLGGNLGYDVRFAFDATHTFDQRDPLTDEVVTAEQLAAGTRSNLSRGFATVVSTPSLVAAAQHFA